MMILSTSSSSRPYFRASDRQYTVISPSRSASATAMSMGAAPFFDSCTISSISCTSSSSVALNLTSRSATSVGSDGRTLAGSLYIAFIAAMRCANDFFMSFHADVGSLRDAPPLGHLDRKRLAQLRRIEIVRLDAFGLEALQGLGQLEVAGHFRGELVDDRRRRARGRADGPPVVRLVSSHAGFGDGRQVGRGGGALRPGRRERSDPARRAHER